MTADQIIVIEEEGVNKPTEKGDSWTEEITVRAEGVLELLSGFVHEANVRRIVVRTRKGRQLFNLPIYSGVAGVVLMGPWTALPLILGLVAECSILIERRQEKE